MSGLRVTLSLSIAGPRGALLETPRWPMALRVAVGAATQPDTLAGKHAFIDEAVPWATWPDALPRLVLVDQTGAPLGAGPMDVDAPLTEDADFLAALKAEIVGRAQAMAERIDFVFEGKRPDSVDDGRQPLSWQGLMNSLSAVAHPTPSALKACWLFHVPREYLATQDAETGRWTLKEGLVGIGMAPQTIRAGSYADSHATDEPLVMEHRYGEADDVLAYGMLLKLDEALAHGLDELDNHWMSIRDSRDDSLLDLADRLEAALTPASAMNALSVEEWLPACVTLLGVDQRRSASSAEVVAALQRWRETTGVPVGGVSKQRRQLILDALLRDADPAEAIRSAYQVAMGETLQQLMDRAMPDPPLPRTEIDRGDIAGLTKVLVERLLPSFARRDPGPCTPNEGIELMVGNERYRLVHEAQQLGASIDDVAGIQLFGRRSSNPALLDTAGAIAWQALTAGHYELADNAGVHKALDRIFGMTATYVDGVLYRELSYRGANLVCRNPVERVHREAVEAPDEPSQLAPLDRLVSAQVSVLRAIPLRYGDHYEFAAGVIDRAGGQATELTYPERPWSFDVTKLATLDPPQRDRVQFLRRVPVGDCNLLPLDGAWPRVPDDIALRCLEEAPIPEPAGNTKPCAILLTPAGDDYRHEGRLGGGRVPLVGEARFRVEPPRLDEHTLQRWLMPDTTWSDAQRQAALKVLVQTLTTLHEARDRQLATGAAESDVGLPLDPAVSAIGLRFTFDGQVEQRHVLARTSGADMRVAVGDHDHFDPAQLTFFVAPGSHVRLGFVALVSSTDFQRMDGQALDRLLEKGKDPWRDGDGNLYRAFTESVVFVEAASAALPKLTADDLVLKADEREQVELRYAFSKLSASERDKLRQVHQQRVSSDRWVWRNLPLPAAQALVLGPTTDEQRRRLASGPPPEIVNPALRDKPDSELVRSFDELAAIDRGFVHRSDVVKRFPRRWSDEIVLHVDNRDGYTAADYLHYRLRLVSRYAGVLTAPESDAIGPRRIGAEFRGDAQRIKPPKVLAVLPLLRSSGESPRPQAQGDGCPFLVVLDEVWFREHGIGERLVARVARVKQEIGEDVEPNERRLGPLPDHSVDPKGGLVLDQELDCFGPFGFSLDRGNSEALANASAFVVYPPVGTPPHYNLFVELSRRLDVPNPAARNSPWSEALPMYSLPDSDALNPIGARLAVRVDAEGKMTYDPGRLDARPFAGAAGDVMRQYRYLLIAGQRVREGGRAVDVFLPQEAMWLGDGTLRALKGADGSSVRGCTAAVVAEVLLNGRVHPDHPDQHPLFECASLRELFLGLLGGQASGLPPEERTPPQDDAPGMIRRLSGVFDITFV
ncbi:hypothetical protein [Ideonella sp. YS5]|uniref:hypothetical protein n=1 Tax=Ideonella sp. YS5 TaxID=3453714 RepID=UPI003EE992AB